MKSTTRQTLSMLVIFASSVCWGGMLGAVELDLGRLTLDLHGFFSQGYLKSDHNNFLAETEKGTFEFREYAVNASTNLTDELWVGAQVFGRDFGDFGNNQPVLDWGVVDYHFQDWLGFRAGRMKAIHGLYNETRDIDMIRTTIFLPESIYNDSFRESFTAMNGAGAYGTLVSDAVGSLAYQVQWGRIRIEKDGGVSRFIQNFCPMEVRKIEISDVYVAGLEFTPVAPLDGLRLRWTWNTWDFEYTAATTAMPYWSLRGVPAGLPLVYRADLSVMVFSAEYRWRNLMLAAETFKPKGYDYANVFESPALGLTFIDDSPNKAGYYASVSYRFTDWLELGAGYSEYYNDATDKKGVRLNQTTGMQPHRAWLKDTTLTARFDLADSWVLKVEGHRMDGGDVLLSDQNPEGTKPEWFLFGAKVTYNF